MGVSMMFRFWTCTYMCNSVGRMSLQRKGVSLSFILVHDTGLFTIVPYALCKKS